MAKINMQRRAEIGEERRQKRRQMFIDAAMKLIAEEGNLYALTPDSLVKKAGSSRGTFYNYYNVIDDVLTDVAEHVTDELNRNILIEYEDVESGPVRLSYSMLQFFEKAERDTVWGTTLAKLILDAGLISQESTKYFETDLNMGRKEGTFTVMDNQIATNVVGGILSFTLNSIREGAFTQDQKVQTLESMLMALGTSKSVAKSSVKKSLRMAELKV